MKGVRSMAKRKYTFMDLIIEVLQEEKKPLTTTEIWEIAEKTGKTNKLGSKGKTPIDSVGANLYWDIKYNNNTLFEKVSTRPTKFGLKNIDYSGLEQNDEDSTPRKSPYNERDLHQLLSSFVYRSEDFACLTKTIYHEQSKKTKKGLNKWLHPDIVGIHFSDDDYSRETVCLQEKLGYNNHKIYSFEMKINLSYSNLQEYYFQAVSNSSWANEGYLVALDICEESEFIHELRRLNNTFGIGIIKLNPENISQSRVIFPSRIAPELDWDTIDKLVKDNPNFESFLHEISSNKKTNKLQDIYDDVFESDEECYEYSKKKHIIN